MEAVSSNTRRLSGFYDEADDRDAEVYLMTSGRVVLKSQRLRCRVASYREMS